jgi:hypothetical protein
MRPTNRSGRLTSLAAALSVLASLLVSLATPTAARAAVGDQPLITYNMQGATAGNDSKWTTTIGGYAERAEVVALQEAGSTSYVAPDAAKQPISVTNRAQDAHCHQHTVVPAHRGESTRCRR